MFVLTTERLRLRRLQEKDLDIFAGYRMNPEVSKYQSWGTASKGEALAFIRGQQAAVGTTDVWTQIGIALKDGDVLVGDCALRVHDNGRQAEYGITLAQDQAGQRLCDRSINGIVQLLLPRTQPPPRLRHCRCA